MFFVVSACARNHVFLHRFCDYGAQFFENRGILRGSRPCAVKNPCVFDDSCVYFDNFMFFYVFSKVGFSKTSCFTCLERLGVSKNVKTPSVSACLTRKHVKTRSFAALFRHPVGKTSCLFAIFGKCVQNTRVFSVLFSCLKPCENVVFLRCFSTARKHRVFAVERRFWEHFLSKASCLVWFPG